MAISIIDTPSKHVSAFNPVIFKLKSDIIPTNTQAQSYYFAKVNDDDGFAAFITQSAAGIEEGDFIEVLVTDKGIDYKNKNYKITKKTNGGAYKNLKTAMPFMGDSIGRIRKVYNNSFMVCVVETKKSNSSFIPDFTEIAQLKIKHDENKEFVFDLQEVLKSEINKISLNEPRYPNLIHNFSIDGIPKRFSVTIPFRISFFTFGEDRFGTNRLEGSTIFDGSDVFFAHNITRQYIEIQNLIEYTTFIPKSTTGMSNWLTNAFGLRSNNLAFEFPLKSPTQKEIGLNEFESVDFIQWQSFQLFVRILLIDKENELIEVLDSPPFIQDYIGRISIMTGTSHIAITPDTASYEIHLFDTGINRRITPILRYRVNRKCKKNKIRLHWLNPLGGIDSFTFVGHQEEGLEIEKNTFKKTIGFPNERNIRDFQLETFNTVAFETFTVNTGKITNFTAKWLKELFESSIVYIEKPMHEDIENMAKLFVPIYILTNSIIVSNTVDELQDISFDYRYAFDRVTF